MTTLTASLLITLIGMGLVFIALGLLWGLMEATVVGTAWYNKSHPEEEEEEEVAEEAPAAEEAAQHVTNSIKQKAAAAAVAVALAFQDEGPEGAAEPQSNGYFAQSSAWKSVMRSAQLTQRSNQFTRKSRGNVR